MIEILGSLGACGIDVARDVGTLRVGRLLAGSRPGLIGRSGRHFVIAEPALVRDLDRRALRVVEVGSHLGGTPFFDDLALDDVVLGLGLRL
ncbi:MAG: hypothetical protein ABI635_11920, partial [Actinomycetota bacterium]